MLKNARSQLSFGIDWFNTYQKKINLITNVAIKNKLLYQEIEQECHKRNGILTYEEYLMIEQFGQHGFYGTNDKHGKTDIDERWGMALAKYCQENKHDTMLEFGCGTSDLGIVTCKAYKKLTNTTLTWIGIEIDKRVHEKIYKNFKDKKISDSIGAIVTTLAELPNLRNTLIVFPYSLDNIPPQIFVNKKNNAYPDALLGVKVENGMLSEIIIPEEILHKKGISFENGIFTQKNVSYKLTSWRLQKGQRAYIAIDAFNILYQYAKKFDDATVIIIDEFRKEPWSFNIGNLGTPKSLYEKNLVCNERARYYRESGRHNLYYPLYKDSLFKFLSNIGYRTIMYEVEQKMAAQLNKKRWVSFNKNYTTFAFTAKNFIEKKINALPIPSPQRKII